MTPNEPLPTTDVSGSPSTLSDLLELDPTLAAEIMYLVDGIEHYHNLRINKPRQLALSLESEDANNSVAKILDVLIKYIARFIKELGDGTAALSFNLGRISNRAEGINTDSRTQHRHNRKDEFVVDTRIANLSIMYRPVVEPQQLLVWLKQNDDIFRNYFSYQNNTVTNVIPHVVLIDPKESESIAKLVDLLIPVSPVYNINKLSRSTSSNDTTVSTQLLGNQKLTILSKNPTGDEVERLLGQEILILPAFDEPKELPSSITYKTFAKTIEQSILRQVINTVNHLESNFGMVSRNRRGQRVDSLIRYLEHLRSKVNTGEYDQEALERAQVIIKLIETYINWFSNPYLGMMALAIRNMTAVLNVCELNN